MSQPAIVDFSRVEEALQLSSRERQLLAARERTKNTAHLIKYAAAGLALVILSIGAAFWLGTQWQLRTLSKIDPPPSSNPWERAASPPVTIPVPENKIMSNVTLFRTVARADLGLLNSYLGDLTAGHRYADSNATAWEEAWCYAMFRKNGLRYQVDLEFRSALGNHPMLASQPERRELGLSDGDMAYLRARCPWR